MNLNCLPKGEMLVFMLLIILGSLGLLADDSKTKTVDPPKLPAAQSQPASSVKPIKRNTLSTATQIEIKDAQIDFLSLIQQKNDLDQKIQAAQRLVEHLVNQVAVKECGGVPIIDNKLTCGPLPDVPEGKVTKPPPAK